MIQRDRVLDALKRTSGQGITQVDFFAPHVIDGGAPITRLAARINELRDAGFTISSSGTRHGCAVYRLVSQEAPAAPTGGAAALAPCESALFDPASLHEPGSPYDSLSDAA